MRYTIETAPRNGNVVVLEDATGTLEVAHWSPEAGEWIGEYGEPSGMTPSHWHPCYSFFSSREGDASLEPTASEIIAPRPAAAVEASIAPSRVRRGFAIFRNAVMVVAVAVVCISLYIRQAELHHHALEEERARSAALESELAIARRETETTGVAQSRNKRDDEAAQLKQAAESETAELRQSLQQEHDRAEALATDLAQARRAMEETTAAVEERPDAKQSEDVAPEISKPEIKPAETVPQPKRRAMSQDAGYGCQHYRTYDAASGTYKGYDGQRHSCP